MKKILAVALRGEPVFTMFPLLESEFHVIYLTKEDHNLLYSNRIDDFISALLNYSADYIFIDMCLEVWEGKLSCGQGFEISKRILRKDPSQKIVGITCHGEPIESEERFEGHGMVDVIHYANYPKETDRKKEVEWVISRIKEIEERF